MYVVDDCLLPHICTPPTVSPTSNPTTNPTTSPSKSAEWECSTECAAVNDANSDLPHRRRVRVLRVLRHLRVPALRRRVRVLPPHHRVRVPDRVHGRRVLMRGVDRLEWAAEWTALIRRSSSTFWICSWRLSR